MIALILSVALAAKEPPPPACAPVEREVKSQLCKCACAWKTGAQRLKWKVTPKKIRAEGKNLCACEVAPK